MKALLSPLTKAILSSPTGAAQLRLFLEGKLKDNMLWHDGKAYVIEFVPMDKGDGE